MRGMCEPGETVTQMSRTAGKQDGEVYPPGSGPTYVLITQCLQNDFLFSLTCRLRLPAEAAGKLLLHPTRGTSFGESGGKRILSRGTVLDGPLGRLLKATVGERLDGRGLGTLHLVNIRDWHTASERYDHERREYGAHCEAGAWGAAYPDALVDFLDPLRDRRPDDPHSAHAAFDARGERKGNVVVHHVHSNSLFDLEAKASGERSELADVLNTIITPENHGDVRVAVIGVYTDVKVQIVLQGIRVAYNPSRLVVSDSLTASPTLERHLAALDFAHKVLGVEVMHGVADLARFLGSDPGDDGELESSASEVAFADYAEYFRDKQIVMSYEDAQLRGYRQQITRQLGVTVRLVNFTGKFLVGWGVVALLASVALGVLVVVYPGRIPAYFPAALLGLSLVQLVSVFFNRPIESLTRMLGSEAVFRMLLESRSLRMALARHHLTTREFLRGGEAAASQIKVIRDQLELLVELDKADFDRFERFGHRMPAKAERASVP